MDPIRTRGYAQSTGFNPGTAPNTAEQQRRQDDEFIKQFKETKETEIQVKANALAQLKEKNRIERESFDKASQKSLDYKSQDAQRKINKLQREYQAQQRLTGGMTAKDKQFNDALELVTNLSQTAIKTYVGFQQQQQAADTAAAEADVQRDIANGTLTPKAQSYKTSQLGTELQSVQADVIDLKQQSAATQIGRETGDYNLESRLKGRSRFYQNAYTKAYAGHIAKDYGQQQLVQLQQEQIDNPEKKYTVFGEQVSVGSLDLSDASILKETLYANLPTFLKNNQLEGVSDIGLGNFYENINKSIDSTVGAIRNAQIEEQREDRMDKAKSIFRMDPTPLNSKLLYTTLTQSGLSNQDARAGMVKQWSSLDSETFRQMGEMPFGPNGIAFKDQYSDEWQGAVNARNSRIQADINARKFIIHEKDQEAILQFNADVLKDMEDGTFDADPAALTEAANNLEIQGLTGAANAIREKIPMTKSAQYDKSFLDNLKNEHTAGINSFSAQQILDNKSLSGRAKQEALGLIKKFEQTAVPSDIKKTDFGIIKTAIRGRAKVNEFSGKPAHDSVMIMQAKAEKRYAQVYKAELNRTQDPQAASQAAIADFYAQFGTDPHTGEYAVKKVLDDPATSGEYVNGTVTGKAYNPSDAALEVAVKMRQSDERTVLTQPEMYAGETQQLQSMLDASQKTGKFNVPQTFYSIQSRSGGNMSMRQLINMRLKANGLEEIPQEFGAVLDEAEQSFDPRYNKYIHYKPNFTRTDIAAVGSGQEPIYAQSTPAQERIKAIFGKRESPQAAYDAINAGSGGDRPGGATRHLGRPLTQMTLGEVKQYQNLPIGDPKGIFAVGKYQFIPETLAAAAVDAGVTDDMLFNEAVQDRIFFVHLDKYGAYQPWEQWWIQQGGSHLALTGEEKQLIEAFRNSYDPSQPWRQPKNVRPELITQ